MYQSFATFESYFLQIKSRSDDAITFRTATEIAARTTTGLFTPIYSQIDPMHVGEAGRSLSIAQHYGERLLQYSKNFSSEVLAHLNLHYPSHGFVIEREEADDLFENVRAPSDEEEALSVALGPLARLPVRSSGKSPIIRYLNSENRDIIEALGNGGSRNGNDAASERDERRESQKDSEASLASGGPEEETDRERDSGSGEPSSRQGSHS